MMCDKKIWTTVDTNKLISMYENRPELWNVKNKNYKNRTKKQNALHEMADEFSVTDEEIYRKVHNLRTQFNHEIRKGKKYSDEDEIFISKWPYFNQLKFLLRCADVLSEDDMKNVNSANNEQTSMNNGYAEEPGCKRIKMDESMCNERNNDTDICYREEKKLWSVADTIQLISMYCSKPELWNAKSKDYKNRTKKRQALVEVAQTFSVTVDEIYRKMHNLRTQFNNELRKTKKSSESIGDVYVSKWPYFDSLKFLLGCTERKSAANNTLLFDASLNSNQMEETKGHTSTDSSTEEPLARIDFSEHFKNTDDSGVDFTAKDEDAYDIFGKFIANEFRQIRFDHLRRKLKRQIQELLIKISAEEEELHEQQTNFVPDPH